MSELDVTRIEDQDPFWDEINNTKEKRDADYKAFIDRLTKPRNANAIKEFKKTDAEEARIAEKEYFKKLANGQEMPRLILGLHMMPKTYLDGTPISDHTAKLLEGMEEDMYDIWQLWKDYTNVNRRLDDNEKIAKAERKRAAELKHRLASFIAAIEYLNMDEISERPEFREAYTFMQGLSVHYEDMMEGSLSIPKGAKVSNHANPSLGVVAANYQVRSFMRRPDYVRHEFDFEYPGDVPLFLHDPCPDDVIQGSLGDCYYLSTLAAIAANNPQVIRDMFKDNHDGTVTVRLFPENGAVEKVYGKEPQYIRVTKSVPKLYVTLRDENGEEYTVERETYGKRALWVQLLEKALAASEMHRVSGHASNSHAAHGYNSMESGRIYDISRAVLGKKGIDVQRLMHHEYNGDSLFEEVKNALRDKKIITAEVAEYPDSVISAIRTEYREKTRGITDRAKKDNIKTDIIFKKYGVPGDHHAYSVTAAIEENGEKYIVVRDPRGRDDYNNGQITEGVTKNPDGTYTIGNGYCKIKASDFAKIFLNTAISTPLDPMLHKNPAAEVKSLSNAILAGFKDSRTYTAAMFRMRLGSASPEFRAMYECAVKLNDEVNTAAPSTARIEKALTDLKAASQTYRDAHVNDFNENNDRNKRYCIADAAIKLADAYMNKDNEGADLSKTVREIEENLVTERTKYILGATAKNERQQEAINEITADPEYTNLVKRLKEEDLLTIATKTSASKFASTIVEYKDAVDKQDLRDILIATNNDAKNKAAIEEAEMTTVRY